MAVPPWPAATACPRGAACRARSGFSRCKLHTLCRVKAVTRGTIVYTCRKFATKCQAPKPVTAQRLLTHSLHWSQPCGG